MYKKPKERWCWFWMASLLAVIAVNVAPGDLFSRPSDVTHEITIYTRDSLRLVTGVYASILFTAKSRTQSSVPVQYSFSQSGGAPPGMIFEGYPCNKPGKFVCPQLASADGVYLDGVPTASGSYRVTIVATRPDGSKGFRAFTVNVGSH